MKLATNASAGRGDELGRRARPGAAGRRTIDADAVGERGRVLEVVRDEQRRQPPAPQQLRAARRGRRAACARRAPTSGSSRSSTARVARERPRERDALPLAARELARPRPGEVPIRKRSSSSPTRRRPPKRDVARARRDAGRARTPGRRSRRDRSSGGDVDAALRRRTRSGRRARSLPAVRAQQARRRRAARVVLPAPEGPTSASVSAPRARALPRGESERRGMSRSRASGPHGNELDGEEQGALTTTSKALIASATSKSTSNCS